MIFTFRSIYGEQFQGQTRHTSLVTHICWKVDREARMEPPIHTEYLRSGGAIILILRVGGAREPISFCMRSAIPGYMVVPPDMTTLANRSFLMSMSHLIIPLYTVSCIPAHSIPMKDGW